MAGLVELRASNVFIIFCNTESSIATDSVWSVSYHNEMSSMCCHRKIDLQQNKCIFHVLETIWNLCDQINVMQNVACIGVTGSLTM